MVDISYEKENELLIKKKYRDEVVYAIIGFAVPLIILALHLIYLHRFISRSAIFGIQIALFTVVGLLFIIPEAYGEKRT
jgi:hypothetical protein